MLYSKEWFPEIIRAKEDSSSIQDYKYTEFQNITRVKAGSAQTLILCDTDPRLIPEQEVLLKKILGSIDLNINNLSIFTCDNMEPELDYDLLWICFLSSPYANGLKSFNARPFWSSNTVLVAPSLQELMNDVNAKKKLWTEIKKRTWK